MTTSRSHIRTLLIEDNPDDALLMQAELADVKRVSFDVEWVERLSKGLERLTEGESTSSSWTFRCRTARALRPASGSTLARRVCPLSC